ncbi:CPBP family intramembrane glutamic endopeptidase [Saccharomonospora sp. NPDC006951]
MRSRDPARRTRVLAFTGVLGAATLGRSLSAPPASRTFYVFGSVTAAVWVAGGLLAGPERSSRRPAARGAWPAGIATGVAAFGFFRVCAVLARRIPLLRKAITGVLRHAKAGDPKAILLTTVINGAAEEVFFRGAVYAAGGGRPVVTSTAAYVLVTMATRNPALVAASAAMGTLCGLQRKASGGITAPVLTHLVWSVLMVRALPRLFGDSGDPSAEDGRAGCRARKV